MGLIACSVFGTAFYIMEYLEGRIFRDPALPGLSPHERNNYVLAMIDTLVALHEVDWRSIGLEGYGKSSR